MTILSGSSLLRCACRTEKQMLSWNASRAASNLSARHLAAAFSSTAASLDTGPTSSGSTSRPNEPPASDSRRSRTLAPFRAPENYTTRAPESPNPIFAKLVKQDGADKQKSAIFGTSNKRVASRAAKEAGAKYKAEQADAEPEHAMTVKERTFRPIKPSDSRSLRVGGTEDFAKQYRRLMGGVINFNNIRTELRLQERYEKPKYKRQRLRSARHRRRFAHEVGLRVAAVLRAKSQGM